MVSILDLLHHFHWVILDHPALKPFADAFILSAHDVDLLDRPVSRLGEGRRGHEDVGRRVDGIGHEGGDKHRGSDLLGEPVHGQSNIHASEAVAYEDDPLTRWKGGHYVQQWLRVVGERAQVLEPPLVDAGGREDVGGRVDGIGHEGGDKHRGSDLLGEPVHGQSNIHASEAVAYEDDPLTRWKGGHYVQQWLRVVGERAQVLEPPLVDAGGREVRRRDLVPRGPQQRRHLVPRPCSMASAMDENYVLLVASSLAHASSNAFALGLLHSNEYSPLPRNS
ncbi:hypothetical protein C4D60_Mb04t03000 [Musa balbisiana]|uniref:Uncharacterized protein n=1 Tax=Musa balbisiana TaxID=52838 RepID=A0A4S8K991_MUSBA|nr:hypothetical protein C4D60_Mb04t03000 [Musa balbisiana]